MEFDEVVSKKNIMDSSYSMNSYFLLKNRSTML